MTFTTQHEREVRQHMMLNLGVKFQCRTTLFDGGVCMGLQVETPAGYQMDYYFGSRSYPDGVGGRIWNPALSLDTKTLDIIVQLCLRCLVV